MQKKSAHRQKEACIFLNGEAPSPKILKHILRQNLLLICADGAANYLKTFKIVPHVILGDLDSIHPSTLAFYQGRTSILKISSQDTTDFEKALLYCQKEHISDITVLGAFNKRSDHNLNNYSVLKRYYRKNNIKILDETFEIFFIKQKITFRYKKGETISLVAMPKALNITTKGLVYPLKKEKLELGVREGTLNEAKSQTVSLSFTSGDLLLFRKHFL